VVRIIYIQRQPLCQK